VVGININGTAPFLGPFLAQFLRSGSEIGGDTLTRFYSLHMLLLPGAIMGLIGLHLFLVVKTGVSSPPWSSEAAGRDRDETPAAPGSGLVNPSARGVTRRPD
jgi:quinol-cytochrome oxidoreductase complex cytochrome b subunit